MADENTEAVLMGRDAARQYINATVWGGIEPEGHELKRFSAKELQELTDGLMEFLFGRPQ